MSQEIIRNEEGNDKNQNESSRSKPRRPDKQLYVPRARREAQNNADVILKPESKTEVVTMLHSSSEQPSSVERKLVSTSPVPSVKNRRGKKKTSDKLSEKLQSESVNSEKLELKNGNKSKTNLKSKKRNGNGSKLKVQPSTVVNKSNDKVTTTHNENCDDKEPLPSEVLLVSQCNDSASKDSSPEVKSELHDKEKENQSDTCNMETVSENTDSGTARTFQLIENSLEPLSKIDLNASDLDCTVDPDQPLVTKQEDTFSESHCEEYYPCQDYFTPVNNPQDEQDLNKIVAKATEASIPAKEDECKKDSTQVCKAPVPKDASEDKISNGATSVSMETRKQRKNSSADDKGDLTWEAMYDDDGECLHPEFVKELTETLGKVKIEKAKLNYTSFQPKEPVINDGEFSHVIEIYDFPAEFKTTDLMTAFSQFRNRGFDIKWVDDTHALGLFASSIAASDALAVTMPFMKTRPLSEASRESKLKARRCAEFLQPYRQRPETSASLARRLVGGALGLQVHVSKEQREKERQKLKDAKEKKRHAAKMKNEVWEGVIPNSLAEVS